jgi:hypothetical protein
VFHYDLPDDGSGEQQYLKVERRADGSYYGAGESFDVRPRPLADARQVDEVAGQVWRLGPPRARLMSLTGLPHPHGPVSASVVGFHPQPCPVTDATRSRDPTGTGRLRAAFRKAAQQRLRRLRAQLRIAVVEHDVLGLSGTTLNAFQPQALRLQAFDDWLYAMAAQALAGNWAQPFIEQAWHAGSEAALREGISHGWSSAPEGGAATLSQLSKQEVKGIVAALVQNVGREAASSLALNKHKAYARLIKCFDKIALNRLSAMANVLTVKAWNQSKLVTYKVNGVNRVGIIPEMVPATRITDARRRVINTFRVAEKKRLKPVLQTKIKSRRLQRIVGAALEQELFNVVTATMTAFVTSAIRLPMKVHTTWMMRSSCCRCTPIVDVRWWRGPGLLRAGMQASKKNCTHAARMASGPRPASRRAATRVASTRITWASTGI